MVAQSAKAIERPTGRCARPGSATPRCSSPRTCASAGPPTRTSMTSGSRCSRRSTSATARSSPSRASASTSRRRLQRRHPDARCPEPTGCPRTGSTSSAPRSSSASAASRSRWPDRSARSRAPRSTSSRSAARRSSSSTPSTRRDAGRCSASAPVPTRPGPSTSRSATSGETRAFGQTLAAPIITALKTGAYHYSASNSLWGARATICVPLGNALFGSAPSLGVFAAQARLQRDCTKASPIAANGASAGQALRSSVAAFGIGDGEFISMPGEVFPFTFLRGFLGPQDMPDPAPGAAAVADAAHARAVPFLRRAR